MQFLVYFTMKKGDPQSPPSPEGMAAMQKLMEDSFKSGIVVATGQLGTETTRVRLSEGAVSVTDGPFIEGKEMIPGFTIISVDSKQDAIEWATKIRESMGDGEMRIAQILVPSEWPE